MTVRSQSKIDRPGAPSRPAGTRRHRPERWTWAVLLLLAACGAGEAPSADPAVWLERAWAAVDAGRWGDAEGAFRTAYALEAPRADRSVHRAYLALQTAQALRHVGEPARAMTWLRRAAALDPSLYVVDLERGLVQEGTWAETADLEAARAAFQRFLAAYEAAGSPEPEAPLAVHARARLAVLDELLPR